MKKLINTHKETVFIVLIIIFLLIAIFLGVWLAPDKKENKKSNEKYHFTGEVKEIEGTTEYSNDDLKKDHCISYLISQNILYIQMISIINYIFLFRKLPVI